MNDTIVAIATPPGMGGVGIVKVSGPLVKHISQAVIQKIPSPRVASLSPFLDSHAETIDIGISLFYPGPNSFTGEDVIEFHGHGGPVILDRLVKRIVDLGARLAKPGEFSERAFLNDKIDLIQAEAIADLIESSSEQAARSAVRSLQGEFSQKIQLLVDKLIELRLYVEAAIDFPEEEIDFLSDGKVAHKLQVVIAELSALMENATQGAMLREGFSVVIAGKPNAGKSTLLNALSGREVAIVTPIAGTTRDVMREHILIDGLPLHIIDTAGLRESTDVVEQEGIRRALAEIENADVIIGILDASREDQLDHHLSFPRNIPQLIVHNKADLLSHVPTASEGQYYISASQGTGLAELKAGIKKTLGFNCDGEGQFIARRRHLDSLKRAANHLETGSQILKYKKAGELLAEDLRLAQQSLNEITGEFTPDDLLGEIFGKFCIGK